MHKICTNCYFSISSASIDEAHPASPQQLGTITIRPDLLRNAVLDAGGRVDTWYYVEATLHDDGRVERVEHLELVEDRERRLMEEYRAQPWPRPWQERMGMRFRGLRPTDDLDEALGLGSINTMSGFYELQELLGRGEDEATIRPLFARAPHLEFAVGTRLNSMEAPLGTVAVESGTGRLLVSWVLSAASRHPLPAARGSADEPKVRRSATGGLMISGGWEEGEVSDLAFGETKGRS